MTLDQTVTNSGGFNVYALGTASAGTPVNNLVFCWAHNSNYVFQISSAFQMLGPTVGNEQCTLTETCSLQLSGVGLADTNKVRIIASSDSCGGGSVVGVTSITGLSGTTAVATGGSSDVYAVASSAITAGVHGSGYTVCWGHNPSANTHYMFEVGTFTLNGPVAENFECPMTVACTIQLTGTDLANTNKVKVQASGTTCSSHGGTFFHLHRFSGLPIGRVSRKQKSTRAVRFVASFRKVHRVITTRLYGWKSLQKFPNP